MKFVSKAPFGENIYTVMKKIGYQFQEKNKEKSEFSLIRPLERKGYPRFHLYLRVSPKTQELTFNLHLDQKRPIYKGAPAHGAEYEGSVVEEEAERIKQILQG